MLSPILLLPLGHRNTGTQAFTLQAGEKRKLPRKTKPAQRKIRKYFYIGGVPQLNIPVDHPTDKLTVRGAPNQLLNPHFAVSRQAKITSHLRNKPNMKDRDQNKQMLKKKLEGTCLVVQYLRIHLPV